MFGALRAALHRYRRQVYSVAYKLLRDKAETEDILQEVFLAIFLQKERYDATRGTVRTWILQFAYFKALLRRRYLNIRNFYRQEEACEGREIRQTSSTESFGLCPAERARCVETGIMSLSPKQRQVVELVHFDGYTLQEASGILRETLANTRNHYYRGLKSLRNLLNAKDTPKKAQETLRSGGKNGSRVNTPRFSFVGRPSTPSTIPSGNTPTPAAAVRLLLGNLALARKISGTVRLELPGRPGSCSSV